jgi:hypothetical protein
MEQSLSWEANRFSASQEIPRKSSPPVPILSQIIPVHGPHPTSWITIIILSSHLSLGLPSRSFHLITTQKPYIHLFSPLPATCPAPLSILDLITRIIFGEEYRSLISSVCSFLHSPVSSSLLLDRSHGFIAPRPLYTGPLCPTLE